MDRDEIVEQIKIKVNMKVDNLLENMVFENEDPNIYALRRVVYNVIKRQTEHPLFLRTKLAYGTGYVVRNQILEVINEEGYDLVSNIEFEMMEHFETFNEIPALSDYYIVNYCVYVSDIALYKWRINK